MKSRKRSALILAGLALLSSVSLSSYKNLDSFNFLNLDVTRGKVIRVGNIDKFGYNDDIDTATTPETIWEQGGKYTYSDVINLDPFLGDDDIDRVSSSNVNDTQQIIIYGLDKEGKEVEQVVQLQGQTPVNLTTKLWRCYRIINDASGNLQGETDGDTNGTVYVYTDNATVTLGVPSPNETIRAIMTDNNQTEMAVYTVPANCTGYLFKGQVGMARSQGGTATFKYFSRRVGKVFNNKFTGEISSSGNSIFKDSRSFPDKIPPLTDIEIRISSVSNNDTGVFATFDILLVKEVE